MTKAFHEFALRAAINVLRDSIESGRMPSGLALEPSAADLHEQAAEHLEAELQALPVRSAQPTVGEGTHRVVFTAELTDEEAWQLAQFFKRASLSDYRANAESDTDAYAMLRAGEQVRKALRDIGYAPR